MRPTLIAFVAGALVATGVTAAFLTVSPNVAGAASVAGSQEKPGALTVDRKVIDGEFIGKLVAAMGRSPGCLGVEVGQFQSGKGVIFGWFKDKASVMAFYRSDLHQEAIDRSGFESPEGHVAMKDIDPDSGPLLVVASAKPGKPDPAKPDAPPPVALAIEIYAPLVGGVRFGGGGFAPEAVAELAKAAAARHGAAPEANR
jgi:hypothetical protein